MRQFSRPDKVLHFKTTGLAALGHLDATGGDLIHLKNFSHLLPATRAEYLVRGRQGIVERVIGIVVGGSIRMLRLVADGGLIRDANRRGMPHQKADLRAGRRAQHFHPRDRAGARERGSHLITSVVCGGAINGLVAKLRGDIS